MPTLAVLAVPSLLIVHRAVLTKQVEFAASRDDKTGMWNTAGWHNLGRQRAGPAPELPE